MKQRHRKRNRDDEMLASSPARSRYSREMFAVIRRAEWSSPAADSLPLITLIEHGDVYKHGANYAAA